MKKVLFLMFLLLLIVLGTANVSAQVRIGGDTVPSAAAVLDLNANNDATPTGNKGALALPRVSLASTTAKLNGANPIAGMLVYNTNTSMTGGNGVGMYFWDGSRWMKSVARSDSTVLYAVKIIYSGPVSVPALAEGAIAAVAIPGLSGGDWCSYGGVDRVGLISVRPGAAAMHCFPGYGACPAMAAPVTCYHATPIY